MSIVAKDQSVHTRVVLSLRSPVDNQLLSLQLEDIERTALTGTYTIADKGIHLANYIEDEISPGQREHIFAVDGRVDVSVVDATVFPPTYRYDIELYLLPHEHAEIWHERRELYSISHPDDAIYLSGSVTLQPELLCDLGDTTWKWLIKDSFGVGFIPTQPSHEVEPRCLELAGVNLEHVRKP